MCACMCVCIGRFSVYMSARVYIIAFLTSRLAVSERLEILTAEKSCERWKIREPRLMKNEEIERDTGRQTERQKDRRTDRGASG